jgi:RNA polymerase sigma-70 factor, ECF subfamily
LHTTSSGGAGTVIPKRGLVQFVDFDQSYLERLANRDGDTERHFVSYFGEILGIKLRSRVGDPYMVEEMRQEVFLRVLRLVRKPNGVREPSRLGPLVNKICDHVILEFRRAEVRMHLQAEENIDQADEAVNVEKELLSVESDRAVRKVLETLPDREQLLLRTIYFEERERDEVCRSQGVDREYLRVLLHRARGMFREKYELEIRKGRNHGEPE